MGSCRDCGHFADRDPRYHGNGGWGYCQRAVGESGFALDETSLAFAQDDEDYKANLVVHKTFGCVQFQPKTESEGEGTSKLG